MQPPTNPPGKKQLTKWYAKSSNTAAAGLFYICLLGGLILGLSVYALLNAYHRKIELLREERDYCFVEMQGAVVAANLISKIYMIEDLSSKIVGYDFRSDARWRMPDETLEITMHWSFHLENSSSATFSPERREAIGQILLAGEYGNGGTIPVRIETVKWDPAEGRIDVTFSRTADIGKLDANSPESRLSLKDFLK